MKTSKVVYGLLVVWAVGVLGGVILASKVYQHQALMYGDADYSSTTGNFEWIRK